MRRLGGEVDDVLVGVLAELGHVIPRIQMSSVAHGRSPLVGRSGGLEAEADGLGAVVVGADRVRWRAAPSCPACTCSGSGSTLTMLPRTLVPSQSTIAGHERHRDAGRGEGHDRERAAPRPRWRSSTLRELGAAARWRRRCAGRRTGRRTPCTRWPRGAGRRPARGSRPAGPATGRPRCRHSHGSCTGRYRELPHRVRVGRKSVDARCGVRSHAPHAPLVQRSAPPFVPGHRRHGTVAAGCRATRLATNERVDNVRVMPFGPRRHGRSPARRSRR